LEWSGGITTLDIFKLKAEYITLKFETIENEWCRLYFIKNTTPEIKKFIGADNKKKLLEKFLIAINFDNYIDKKYIGIIDNNNVFCCTTLFEQHSTIYYFNNKKEIIFYIQYDKEIDFEKFSIYKNESLLWIDIINKRLSD
jgi:hypothetical protein